MRRFRVVLGLVMSIHLVAARAQTTAPTRIPTPTGHVITIDTTRPVCVDNDCTTPVVWQGWQVLPTGIYNTKPFPGPRPPWWQGVIDVLDDLGVNRVSLGARPGIQNPTDWFGAYLAGIPTPPPPPGTGDWLFQYVPGAPIHWSQLDLYVENVFLPLKQRLASHGEPFFWNFEYYNNSRQHGANFTTFRDDPAQFAAWVNAIWTHLDSKYGLVPDSFSLNEPSTTGDCWTAAQIGAAIKAVGDSLAASGWHPRFAAPTSEHVAAAYAPPAILSWLPRGLPGTCASNAPADFDALIVQPGVRTYLTDVDYHIYGGYAPADLQAMVTRAAQYGLPLGMSEKIGVDAVGLQDLLANGKISFFRQYNMGGYSAGAGSTGTHNSWLFYIDTIDNNSVHITDPNGYFMRQYFKFIHMNAREVHSESTLPYGMRPVAFVNPNGAPVVVVNVVSAGAGGSFSVVGLPAGTYNIKYSVTGDVDHDLVPQTIGAGEALTTSIPAAGVITVYRTDTIIPTNTVPGTPEHTPTPPNKSSATPTQTARETATTTPGLTDTPAPTPKLTPPVTPTTTGEPVRSATLPPTDTATPTATMSACVGDCDASGNVTVDELLRMVTITLGSAPISECPDSDINHDGQFTIDEVLLAVNDALNGCL
jgi:hypothetical protein